MSEYMRVSCANCVRNGLTAHSAAQTRPARRPNRLQPAHMPPGTETSAMNTDSAWVSPGPLPTRSIQTESSM
jgi:hypothetical protein